MARAVGCDLPLCVLRRLARSLETVLLPLLHPRVPREKAGLTQRQPVGLDVELEQRSGDPVADRTRLTGDAAALDLDHDVELALGPGHAEGHADVGLVDRVAEVLG